MKCFCDMDGVLTDFCGGYNTKYNTMLPPEVFNEHQLFREIGKSVHQLDADLGREFWAKLSWMPNGQDVLRLLESEFGAKNIYLLTFPSYNPEGAAGKVDWVHMNMPDYKMRLIMAMTKHVCAGPQALLFDDKERNVVEFKTAGGNAILVPAPWNSNRHEYHRIVDFLSEQIKRIISHNRSKDGKMRSVDFLTDELARHRSQNETIVFTNGCFDIVHRGHIELLKFCKSQGNIVVVGLNSDSSVKIIKGPDRPINNQDDRADVLAALETVDYITVFDEPSVLNLIKKVKPDILVKGQDWAQNGVVGREFVESYDGEVVRFPLVEGKSSTATIGKMKSYESFAKEYPVNAR